MKKTTTPQIKIDISATPTTQPTEALNMLEEENLTAGLPDHVVLKLKETINLAFQEGMAAKAKGMWVSKDLYDEIYEVMRPGLNVVGNTIRTGTVWRMMTHSTTNYSTVAAIVRHIFRKLFNQGKMERINHGLWKVVEPVDLPSKQS